MVTKLTPKIEIDGITYAQIRLGLKRLYTVTPAPTPAPSPTPSPAPTPAPKQYLKPRTKSSDINLLIDTQKSIDNRIIDFGTF